MATTIQISNELRNLLVNRKMHPRDTFEDVIFDLIEDTMELSEETKKNLAEIEKDVEKNGYKNFVSFEQIKKEAGL
jgi:hypothetical protein